MADAGSPPNQITFEEVCYIAGKLFLESQYEITRLASILTEMQKKLGQEIEEKNKLEKTLKETNKILENLSEKE